MLTFDLNKTLQQAQELRSISNDMQNMRGSALEATKNIIKDAWLGDTSQRFINKCDDLDSLVDKEAKRIIDIADNLKISAYAIDEAERAAAEAARNAARVAASGSGGSKSIRYSVTK